MTQVRAAKSPECRLCSRDKDPTEHRLSALIASNLGGTFTSLHSRIP
jgi:hypothetical protein